jgi:hypothetical protein
MKRYAAPLLLLPDGSFLLSQIIELNEEGSVIRYYPFESELQSTIWLSGLVEICPLNGINHAYHLYPYDLTNKKSVDGTQRILLQ